MAYIGEYPHPLPPGTKMRVLPIQVKPVMTGGYYSPDALLSATLSYRRLVGSYCLDQLQFHVMKLREMLQIKAYFSFFLTFVRVYVKLCKPIGKFGMRQNAHS